MSDSKTKRHKGTHKSAMPLGIVIVIFSLIGFVTVIFACVTGVKYLIEKNRNFEEYNKMLTPVVLIDPTNFDDITHADMNELIEISIWSILKSDISPDKYETGSGGLTIPQEDVEKAFTDLFGSELSPKHATIEGYDYEFAYDADSKSYTVPLTSVTPIYTPDVISSSKSSDSIILTVAMISANGWEQAENGKLTAPSPDKYIKVTLRTVEGKRYISAIQTTGAPEIASTAVGLTEKTSESPDLIEQAEQVASETEAAKETEKAKEEETDKSSSQEETTGGTETETESATEDNG